MISVLIAEDEPLERRALKALIQREFDDKLVVVAECASGSSVEAEALTKRPDLMLVDVEMPELTGLEALERMRAGGVSAEFIVLTAYGKFSYAQQALRLGAHDYLLKPVSRDSFVETMRSLIERIETRKRLAREGADKSELAAVRRTTLERELMWQLGHPDEMSSRVLDDLASVLSIEAPCYLYASVPPSICGNAGTILLNRLRGRLSGAGHPTIGALIGGYVEILVCLGSEMDASVVRCSVEAERSATCPDREGSIEIIGPVARLSELVAAIESGSPATPFSASHDYDQKSLDRFRAEQELSDIVVRRDIQSVSSAVRNLFHHLNDDRFTVERARAYAVEVASVVDRRLLVLFSRRFSPMDPSSIAESVARVHRVGAVAEILEEALRRSISLAKQNTPGRRYRVVEAVQRYLRDHIAEALSLSQTADELGISPGYVSRCFKDATGMSFKEFQTMYRMFRAKELLRVPGSSVTKTAAAVGYSDPNYFSKVFRKEVGVSPTDFAGN